MTWSAEKLVGLSRFELLTPRLSSVCSNQLSYRPSSPLSRHSPRSPTGGTTNFSKNHPPSLPCGSFGETGSFKTRQDVFANTRQVSDRSDCPPSRLAALR